MEVKEASQNIDQTLMLIFDFDPTVGNFLKLSTLNRYC